MKKNKFILCLSMSIFSLITIPLPFNENQNIVNLNEKEENKQIKIKNIKYSSTHYGSERISFVVNPKINSDEINYSLTYIDNSNVESDIFKVLFMPRQEYIDITCLKPFTKRVVLTLFATSNEDIKDSIYLDFKERITVNPTLKIDENSPLIIESNITTTGGSIKIDKTISNEKLTFSTLFVESLKSKLKDRFESKYYTNPQTTYYHENSSKYMGLDDKDCTYWLNNNFTYASFLQSIYYEVDYYWIESDSDYEAYELDKVYTYDLLEDDFYTLFDGINPVFTYSYMVNNQTYTIDLGLLIDQINIVDITINNKDIIF